TRRPPSAPSASTCRRPAPCSPKRSCASPAAPPNASTTCNAGPSSQGAATSPPWNNPTPSPPTSRPFFRVWGPYRAADPKRRGLADGDGVGGRAHGAGDPQGRRHEEELPQSVGGGGRCEVAEVG